MTPAASQSTTTDPDFQRAAPFVGRFVCMACAVELVVVRLGCWRCPSCGETGPIAYPLAVMTGPPEVEDWPTERWVKWAAPESNSPYRNVP